MEKQLSDLEEETSKLADRVTAALVIFEEHKRDHREKLKLLSNKAWAKNQSNDTTRKNLPNHCREVDAPLQCFGMEIESLERGDGGVVVFNDLPPREAWCQRCGTNRCGKLFGLIWTSGIVCVYVQLPRIGMFRGSMGGMAKDGYSSAKCGKPIGWSMSLS